MAANLPINYEEYIVFIRTCTFNQALYIKDCLDGVAMQKTTFPFIHLVIDDCSTDGEQEVIKEYIKMYFVLEDAITLENELSTIIIAKHKSNPNYTIAAYFLKQNMYGSPKKEEIWNPWRKACTYEAFCEGDDCWINPNKLSLQVEFLESHPDYVLSHTEYNEYNENTCTIKKNLHQRHHNLCITCKDLGNKLYDNIVLGKYSVITLTVVARTSLILKVRDTEPFFKEKGMKMGDTPLWTGLSKYGKFHYIKEPMAMYRVAPESATHSRNFSNVIDFYQNCIRMVDILTSNRQNGSELYKSAERIYIHLLIKLIYLDKWEYMNEVQEKIHFVSQEMWLKTRLLINTITYPAITKRSILSIVAIVDRIESATLCWYNKLF